MTCIVALVEHGRVHLGADTLQYSDGPIQEEGSKLWTWPNGMILGAAGDARAADLLRHDFTPPAQTEHQADRAYMRVDFAAAVRAYLKDQVNVSTTDKNEDCQVALLIGWRGRLWVMYSNYAVNTPALPYHAIGSGGPAAAAALHTTHRLGWTPRERLQQALETATLFNVYVRPPFTFESDEQAAPLSLES